MGGGEGGEGGVGGGGGGAGELGEGEGRREVTQRGDRLGCSGEELRGRRVGRSHLLTRVDHCRENGASGSKICSS